MTADMLLQSMIELRSMPVNTRTETQYVGHSGDPTAPLRHAEIDFAGESATTSDGIIVVGSTLRGLAPRLRLDPEEVLKHLQGSGDTVELSIHIDLPHLRLTQELYSDLVADMESITLIDPNDSSMCDLPIVSDARLRAVLLDKSSITCIARKSFPLTLERSGSQFPHTFQTSEWFGENDLPEDTLWFLEVNAGCFDEPPEGCFMLNIHHKMQLYDRSKGGQACFAVMVASVIGNLIEQYLLEEDLEVEPRASTAFVMRRHIEKSGQSVEVLRKMTSGERAPVLSVIGQTVATTMAKVTQLGGSA